MGRAIAIKVLVHPEDVLDVPNSAYGRAIDVALRFRRDEPKRPSGEGIAIDYPFGFGPSNSGKGSFRCWWTGAVEKGDRRDISVRILVHSAPRGRSF